MLHFFDVINGHYDNDISNILIFCKDKNTRYNLTKNDTQDLVPNFVELVVLNIVFLTAL